MQFSVTEETPKKEAPMSAIAKPFSLLVAPMALLGVICGVQAADAQTVQITAAGTIQKVSDIENSLDASVTVGTPFTFTYLFDYVPPTPEGGITETDFYFFPAALGASATVGDYAFTSGAAVSNNMATVSVVGQYPLSDIDFGSNNQTLVVAGKSIPYGGSSGIYLRDNQGRITTTGALPPLSAFNLPLYDAYAPTNQGTFYSGTLALPGTSSDVVIWGQINRLSARFVPPTVPEPTPAALLGIGALGLAVPVLRAHRREA